jgi:hypothetical protein
MADPNTNFVPLGRIAPTAGSPLGIFSVHPEWAESLRFFHMLMIQSDPNNWGLVYLGSTDLNVAARAGINFVLPAPGDSFSIGSYTGGNVFDGSRLLVDVEYTGDGAYVSVLIR